MDTVLRLNSPAVDLLLTHLALCTQTITEDSTKLDQLERDVVALKNKITVKDREAESYWLALIDMHDGPVEIEKIYAAIEEEVKRRQRLESPPIRTYSEWNRAEYGDDDE